MPVITVPKEFFRQERRNIYGDWRAAFWRELFQNSIDAGADRIEIGINTTADEQVFVLFSDNGCGMSRDVIENVYFRLGETTKADDSIGGFGRARIVTCFSMVGYQIWTQNNHVVGDGAHYEVHDHPWRDGCHLRIDVDDRREYLLRRELDDFLKQSEIPARVFIDGNPSRVEPHPRGQQVRQLEAAGTPYADVFVSDEGLLGQMLVRVRGVLMHSRYVRVQKQVVVEIDPALSRRVLTASRDSLMGEYSSSLNEFTDRLAIDVETALKVRRSRLSTVIAGRERFRRKHSLGASNVERPAMVTSGYAAPTDVHYRTEVIASAADVSAFETDIHVVQDTESEVLIRSIPRFVPTNWVEMNAKGRTYQKGSTARKLLAMWAVACEGAVDAFLASRRYDVKVSYSVGWIFSDSLAARCDAIDGGHVFLLNPVDERGKLRYKISDRSSQKRLMALAKHEVAHVVEKYHDERYAGILTEIDAGYDEATVFRKMKSVK